MTAAANAAFLLIELPILEKLVISAADRMNIHNPYASPPKLDDARSVFYIFLDQPLLRAAKHFLF